MAEYAGELSPTGGTEHAHIRRVMLQCWPHWLTYAWRRTLRELIAALHGGYRERIFAFIVMKSEHCSFLLWQSRSGASHSSISGIILLSWARTVAGWRTSLTLPFPGVRPGRGVLGRTSGTYRRPVVVHHCGWRRAQSSIGRSKSVKAGGGCHHQNTPAGLARLLR